MHVDEVLGKLQEMLALPEGNTLDKTAFEIAVGKVPETFRGIVTPLFRCPEQFPARMPPMKGRLAGIEGLADAYALIERFDIRVAALLLHPVDVNPSCLTEIADATENPLHWLLWGTQVFFTDRIEPHRAYLFGEAPSLPVGEAESLCLLQPVEWCSQAEWDVAHSVKPIPEFPGDPGVCPACHQVLGSGMIRCADEPKGNIPVDPETGMPIIVEGKTPDPG